MFYPRKIVLFAFLSIILFSTSTCNESKVISKNFSEDSDLQKNPPKFPNKPFVYYAFLNNIELVPKTAIQKDYLELPESLIISPGKYNFQSYSYELRKEGLYRFVFPGKENQQRIVYDCNVDALLSSLSWIVSHGNSDTCKSYNELTLKATKSKLFITCGEISGWAHYILNTHNIKSRIVSSLTLDEWNSYDNGHTLIEIFRKEHNKWIVYDLDQNAYFSHNGIPLSLIEFASFCASGNYEIMYISHDIKLDVSNFLAKGKIYDYAFILERIVANKNSLKQWYKRIMQVPMIRDGDYFYFFDESNHSRIESYSNLYRFIGKDQFMRKFY